MNDAMLLQGWAAAGLTAGFLLLSWGVKKICRRRFRREAAAPVHKRRNDPRK